MQETLLIDQLTNDALLVDPDSARNTAARHLKKLRPYYLIPAEIIFTMGLPAAGKSTWVRNNLVNYQLIDPDEIKKNSPYYDPR